MNSDPARGVYLITAAAGLAGAVGVSLAAIAAHRVESPALATAATMLMIHAAAVVAIAALAARLNNPKAALIIASLMLASVALFSGDIALNTLAGFHIFPFAAPVGGMGLIACWALLAVYGVIAAIRSSSA